MENYITLEVPGTDLMVSVKLDDDGVIVDVFSDDNDSEPVATTWRTYSELGKEVKDEDPDKVTIVWQIDDVKGLDNTLSDQDCVNILHAFEKHHEGSMESMWADLQYHIDNYKEERND